MASLRNRVPLPWANLTHNKRRLVLAVAGIGFAVLLMFMQIGFRDALFNSTVQLPRQLDADLVIVNRAKMALTIKQPFSRERLYQALSCEDVASAYPLYIENRSSWKNPHTGHSYLIRAMAFDPSQPVLLMDEVRQQTQKLLMPATVLFDRRAKREYGLLPADKYSQFAGQRAKVVGLFTLGTDFATDGNLVMSDVTYAKFLFPNSNQQAALGQVDVGVVKLKPGADPRKAKEHLKQLLPDDVKVLTKREYVTAEQQFWAASTPIGYIFGFGTALGFVVGIIICYQILYADISDHLPEYATLKAMGYGSRYFMGVVLQEALLLAVMGFVPGVLIAALLYLGLSSMTGMLLALTALRSAQVLLLTVTMCVVSGILTIRRVLSTDPAELFV
jgi:DevC protein